MDDNDDTRVDIEIYQGVSYVEIQCGEGDPEKLDRLQLAFNRAKIHVLWANWGSRVARVVVMGTFDINTITDGEE